MPQNPGIAARASMSASDPVYQKKLEPGMLVVTQLSVSNHPAPLP
jgi:hypothetical protein